MTMQAIVTLSVFIVSMAGTLFAIGRVVGKVTTHLDTMESSFNTFSTEIERKVSYIHDQTLTITARCPLCNETTPTPVRRAYP